MLTPERMDRMPPGTVALQLPHILSTTAHGMDATCRTSPTHNTSAVTTSAHANEAAPTQSATKPAPKPIKKRYLAEQTATSNHNNSNSNSGTPTPSATPTPPISPADTARACEALLELHKGGNVAESRSPGSRSPAPGSGYRSNGGSGYPSPVGGSGSRSPTEGAVDSNQSVNSKVALRKSVWKSVLETASKQKEAVTESTAGGETANKGTINNQQIIDHVIENLLLKNGDNGESGDASNSSSNNKDESATDNSDRIKASIYESLKNDLLKDKNHSTSKPGDLPFKNLQVGRARKRLVGEEATRVPSESTSGTVTPTTNASLSPTAAIVTTAAANVSRSPAKLLDNAVNSRSLQPQVMSMDPSSGNTTSSATIMRLVTPQSLATPVSLSRTSVTITRQPRTTGGSQSPHHAAASLLATSFQENSNNSHSTTSLTLTPSAGGVASSAQHQQTTTLLPISSVRISNNGTTPGGVRSVIPVVGGGGAPALPVHTLHLPVTVALHNNTSSLQQQPPGVTTLQQQYSPPFSIKQQQSGSAATLIIPKPATVGVNNKVHHSQHQLQGAPPRQLLITTVPVSSQSSPSDCGAVNLTVKRPSEEDLDNGHRSRSCKGKRYQEFIEDGRISVGGSNKKRRSHGDEEETALNLSTSAYNGDVNGSSMGRHGKASS